MTDWPTNQPTDQATAQPTGRITDGHEGLLDYIYHGTFINDQQYCLRCTLRNPIAVPASKENVSTTLTPVLNAVASKSTKEKKIFEHIEKFFFRERTQVQFRPKMCTLTQNRRGIWGNYFTFFRPPRSFQTWVDGLFNPFFHWRFSPETQSKQGGVMKL